MYEPLWLKCYPNNILGMLCVWCGHLQENSLSQLLMTKLFAYIGKYFDWCVVITRTNVISVGYEMMILDCMTMYKCFCSRVLLKVWHFLRYDDLLQLNCYLLIIKVSWYIQLIHVHVIYMYMYEKAESRLGRCMICYST